MSIKVLVFAVVFLAGAMGCGGNGVPVNPYSPSVPSKVSVRMLVAVVGGGSYTALINGQIYPTTGVYLSSGTYYDEYSAAFSPGTYEISGSYSGGRMIIGFKSISPSAGGVQFDSVHSLAGSVMVASSCSIVYSEGFGMQTFRLRFTVGTNPNSAC